MVSTIETGFRGRWFRGRVHLDQVAAVATPLLATAACLFPDVRVAVPAGLVALGLGSWVCRKWGLR